MHDKFIMVLHTDDGKLVRPTFRSVSLLLHVMICEWEFDLTVLVVKGCGLVQAFVRAYRLRVRTRICRMTTFSYFLLGKGRQ